MDMTASDAPTGTGRWQAAKFDEAGCTVRVTRSGLRSKDFKSAYRRQDQRHDHQVREFHEGG
jgi:hypothetical protein